MARAVSLIVDAERQLGAQAEPCLYRAHEPGGWDRHAETLQALPERRFERALQVGCAGGALTAELAPRCGQLIALGSFPQEPPRGVWDLVVCEEVLHRLDLEALLRATHWLSRQLCAGASVLVASRDSDVHRLLAHRLACWHAYAALSGGLRIDRFDGDFC